jgi:NADH-quinone oxidoreductase subunit C
MAEPRQDGAAAAERIRTRFADAVVEGGSFRDQHWIELRADRLLEVCAWLRDEPACRYEMLLDVTAAHWPDSKQPMEVIYHLYSLGQNDRLRLKVRTGDRGPVPSLTSLWSAAEWNEREAFDMFGIVFEGHPDLRRILMPDDYTDYPLRKELPLYTG